VEQGTIARFLEKATASVATTIERTHREIDLLSEYRIRLIADVVTGKLDVREAAARLPDEIEETEPLDEIDSLTDAEELTDDELDATSEEANA
jgi:type I restriction enzyme S subunit